MQTHILVECPELIASVRLGVLDPLRPLEEAQKCQVRFVRTSDIKGKDLEWSDILVTVRGCDPLTRRTVKKAKDAGRKILYYLDDDLLHIPEESLVSDYYRDTVVISCMHEILEMCDCLWSSNQRIIERYYPLTNDAKCMRTDVPKSIPWEIKPDRGRCRPVKILYAGSTDHTSLVQEILVPVLEKISEVYKDQVDITILGACPQIKDSRIHLIPYIESYDRYQKTVQQGGFAIGLAPGRTDDYYACKYVNKFVEYTSIGATAVYTNAEPYTQVIVNEENGILCDNTFDGWYTAITRLIDCPELLDRCTQSALQLLRTEYEPQSVACKTEQQYPLLCTFKAPNAHIRLTNQKILYYWMRAGLTWRKQGFLAVPVLAYKAVRKIASFAAKEVKRLVQKVY